MCTKGCEGLHTTIMHWISLAPGPEEEENGPGNEASTGSEHTGGGLTETEQSDRNHSCLCRSTPSEHLAEKKIIKSVVQLLMYTIFPLFVCIPCNCFVFTFHHMYLCKRSHHPQLKSLLLEISAHSLHEPALMQSVCVCVCVCVCGESQGIE